MSISILSGDFQRIAYTTAATTIVKKRGVLELAIRLVKISEDAYMYWESTL